MPSIVVALRVTRITFTSSPEELYTATFTWYASTGVGVRVWVVVDVTVGVRVSVGVKVQVNVRV
jgi:hypothetical protein